MDDLLNTFVEVNVVQEFQTLSVTFLGFVPTKDFIPILEYEYALIEHYRLQKCFIDLRLIPVYGKGSTEYVKDVWFPKVTTLGVRYVAFVVPEAVVGQMSMRSAHTNVGTEAAMTVEHFSDPDKARTWLQSC